MLKTFFFFFLADMEINGTSTLNEPFLSVVSEDRTGR